MKGQRLTGPMHWHRLIARSRLSLTEKAVCFSMMEWMDWGKEGDQTIWPSASSMARGAGCAERTIQRTLEGLAEKGVIESSKDRRGGRVEGGKPRTNRIRISQKGLMELNPDTESGLEGDNPDSGSSEPRQPDPDTPTLCPSNPDTVSPDQTKEQTKEQTTITKGGGGDGDSQSDSDAQKREQAQRLLEDREVSHTKAEALAGAYPPVLIEWAVKSMGKDGKLRWQTPGLLVTTIQNGDAEHAWESERCEDEAKRRKRRAKGIQRMFHLVSKDMERADTMLPQVKAVWPTVEDLSAEWPLSDEDLFSIDGREWAVLEALYAEAQRRASDGNQLHKADSSGKGESGSTPTGETGR
jgi:hypothetical protein